MNSTLDKALAELQSSPDTPEGKMDEFRARLELTYTMLVEHYDGRLRDGLSDMAKINEILDERIKTRHIVEWAEALPPDYDLATAIVKFQKMPKPGDDTFAQG